MDNLRSYLASCSLPPMPHARNAPPSPPQGHKSHKNHLHIRPETWRRLENIFPLEGPIDQAITSWMDNNIPDVPLDPFDIDFAEEQLTIPSPSMAHVSLHMMTKPDSVLRMVPWLDSLPLQTIQSTVHLLYPQLLDWGFNFANDPHDVDRDTFQYFCWSKTHPESVDTDSGNTLTIAFQPPWILSDQDIKEFAECRSFPPFRKVGNAYPTTLESQHRVWAKIWDVCVRRRTRWFILTSYNNWVLGAFSEGWSSGFVTGVYTYDSYNPSIAECLTFWVVSSMHIAGSASVPRVGDESEYFSPDTPCTVYDITSPTLDEVPEPLGHHIFPVSIPLHRADLEFGTPADSESNWDGKNDEVGSSAGVWSNLSETDSYDSGLPGPIRPLNRPRQRFSLRDPLITTWLAKTSSNLAPDAPAIIPPTVGKLLPELPMIRLGDWLV